MSTSLTRQRAEYSSGGRWERVDVRLAQARWRYWALRFPVLRETNLVHLGRGSSIRLRGAGRIEAGRGIHTREDVTLAVSGHLTLGDGVYLGRGVNLACTHRMTIGANTRLAERVSVHDADHVFEPISDIGGRRRDLMVGATSIGAGVWLAGNVVVVAGVSIGDDTVVAAGSVVTRDLPPGVLAAGSPARVIRALD